MTAMIGRIGDKTGWVAAAMASALLWGCVGPDFERPAPPSDAAGYGQPVGETASGEVAGGEAQHLQLGRDVPAEWWSLFQSEPLTALVGQALKANPNLQAAQAALVAAQENTKAQQGGFWPSLTGSLDATRAKDAGSVSSNSTSPSPIYNLYTAQLGVSYSPDVWGGTWRQVESAEAQEEAQRFQLEATVLTLASNVVVAAVNEASLRGQIAATGEIIRIERELLDILRRQFGLGQIAEADVVAQEAAVAQAEQTLPPLAKQLEQSRDALAALVGALPAEGPAAKFEMASLHLPQDLPVSLPSKLVEQRPDIRQAEANLHAASAQLGVAIAARLPLINLTAGMGSTAAFIGGSEGLFTPGMGFWNLSGGLTLPLFDGFTLLHKERAARALLDQAEAQYRATVIGAFQNVADSLSALRQDSESLRAAAITAAKADQSLTITRRQLELGAVSYPALLNAEQTELQARITLVQAQAARFADTAALFQALGGGWWNRPAEAADVK